MTHFSRTPFSLFPSLFIAGLLAVFVSLTIAAAPSYAIQIGYKIYAEWETGGPGTLTGGFRWDTALEYAVAFRFTTTCPPIAGSDCHEEGAPPEITYTGSGHGDTYPPPDFIVTAFTGGTYPDGVFSLLSLNIGLPPPGETVGFTGFEEWDRDVGGDGDFYSRDITNGRLIGTIIPEPSTIMLLSTGLLGLGGYRWSQRRRKRLQVG